LERASASAVWAISFASSRVSIGLVSIVFNFLKN
jgi:hypothetical protein